MTTVTITHFDTAMALLEIGSVRLLTDPVLDPAGSVFEHGPIRLEKTSAPSVTAAGLGRIDAVLLSHDQHGDNLDGGGRALLPSVGVVLTTPTAAKRLEGVRAVGLDAWATRDLTGPDGDRVSITAVLARHGPAGTEDATGPVTGFVIDWPGRSGPGPIYVSGDTVRFAGTDEIARRYAPVGLAILNIGRVRLAPMGALEFSLSASEAVFYAQALQARIVVPLRAEGWRHFSEDRIAAQDLLAGSNIAERVHWLVPGAPERFDV